MRQHLPVIKNATLFAGIKEEEILPMLDCLSATVAKYKKQQFIFREGEPVRNTGLLLSGMIHVIKEDFWGNRTILTEIKPGQLFAETYACMQSEPMESSVMAVEECHVMWLNCRKIITVCSSNCVFHNRLIGNLLRILAGKNLALTRKMEHLTKRTTREKLLSYLSEQAQLKESSEFDIPFNRQQLADYLSVDRSAMSSELGRMKKDGLLDFSKNHFILLFHQPTA